MKRLYNREDSRRKVPWVLIAIPAMVLIAFIFLRGPNGLLRIHERHRRVSDHERKLQRLRTEIDSLRRLRNLFEDTAFIREYATHLLGTPDSTPDRP